MIFKKTFPKVGIKKKISSADNNGLPKNKNNKTKTNGLPKNKNKKTRW